MYFNQTNSNQKLIQTQVGGTVKVIDGVLSTDGADAGAALYSTTDINK